jgi:hypothetical protein
MRIYRQGTREEGGGRLAVRKTMKKDTGRNAWAKIEDRGSRIEDRGSSTILFIQEIGDRGSRIADDLRSLLLPLLSSLFSLHQ